MQGSLFSYGLLTALAIALLVAAFTDLRRRQIDNKLTAAIAVTAPLFWWASSLSLLDVAWQLAIAAVSLVILAGLFAVRWMGGGDVKLLTALALWIKPALFAQLIIVMSLIGLLLTVGFGAWHIARRQNDRVAIPYGIAIACAGLFVLANSYFPALRNGVAAG